GRKLADDLDALLELRDILARPPGALRRVRKTVRRHPGVAMGAAAAVLVAVALAIHHVARTAAEKKAALSEARSQLATYEQVRDRALAPETAASELDEQATLRPPLPEELARHGQGDGA